LQRKSGHLFVVKNRLPAEHRGPVEPLITEAEVQHSHYQKAMSTTLRSGMMGLRKERTLEQEELAGCCCDCCHAYGCNFGPKFPHINNANQCLTPTLFSSICRLGYHLSEDAVRALTRSGPLEEPWEQHVD